MIFARNRKRIKILKRQERVSPWLKLVVFEGERYSVDAMFVLLSSENVGWIISYSGWIFSIWAGLCSIWDRLGSIGAGLFC